MSLQFFAPGAPADPPLAHYKRLLGTAGADAAPVWHLDPANVHLLLRGVSELAQRGVRRLALELAAEDQAEDRTRIPHEGELVPAMRRALQKKAADFELTFRLSTGRPYVLPPPSLDISTNDLCGLKCVMCGNRNTRRDPLTIAPETVRDLLGQAARWGIKRVALTGAGEPFRDFEMLAHVELAASLGQLVTITTNGLPVTDAIAEKFAGIPSSISVSIHGATEAQHDAITGVPGSATHAWTAIRRLAGARDRSGLRHLSVNVSSVIQRANVHEIEALVRRSQDEGCDGHNLQPINLQHGHFRAGEVVRRDDAMAMAALWPTAEQAPELDRLFEALPSYSHLRTTPERLALFRRYFADTSREALGVTCRVGEQFLAVDHRGRIKPCYRLPWDMGDARLTRVQELWNSRAYARTRAVVAACPLTCMNNCFFRK